MPLHLLEQPVLLNPRVTQEAEATAVRPVLIRPAREAEDKCQIWQLHRVEAGETAALQVNVHALSERQEWFDQIEASAAPGANGVLFGVIMFRAAQTDNMFPRF